MNPIKKMPVSTRVLLFLTLVGFTAMLAIDLTGCASPNPNAGQVTVTTNPTTGVTTTNVQPPFIPNTGVTSVTSTIGSLNDATAALDPYSGLIKLGLGLTTLVAGGIAAWQNNKAKGLNAQLTSVVQGVEAATTDAAGNNVSGVTGAAVKQAIRTQAVAAGVQPALDATVQKLT